jgi:hypothetical protein
VHRTPGATAPPVSPVAGEPVTGGPVIHRHRCMPICDQVGFEKIVHIKFVCVYNTKILIFY